jgi:hypothetical protein
MENAGGGGGLLRHGPLTAGTNVPDNEGAR